VIGNIDGLAERQLVTRSLDFRFLVGTPAWSRDGKTIAVGAITTGNGGAAREVLLVNVADGQVKELTKENYGQVLKVSWLNDLELLIIAVEHTFKDAQIWHVSLPGGEVRHINSDLYSYEAPLDLSADNESLLVIETQTLTNIWSHPPEARPAQENHFGTIGERGL
jgi:Tol biopolymer transport system component